MICEQEVGSFERWYKGDDCSDNIDISQLYLLRLELEVNEGSVYLSPRVLWRLRLGGRKKDIQGDVCAARTNGHDHDGKKLNLNYAAVKCSTRSPFA